MQIYECYFDGCCEPKNPNGYMGLGVYIKSGDNEYKTYNYDPPKIGNTNNIAEYKAFSIVLKLLKNKNNSLIKIFGDSLLVINQMKGEWKIKQGAYKKYAIEAMDLLKKIKKNNNEIILQWIPRDQNTIADNLSKKHLTLK